MSKISRDTVKKISDLIKIKISDDKLDSYVDQLNNVLNSIDVLNEIDTTNVPTTDQTHNLMNVYSNDEVAKGLDMTKYKNIKNFNGKYFVVKKVI